MSSPIEHPSAKIGDLDLHNTGCVYYRNVHHISWIDDNCARVITSSGVIKLLGPQELKDLETLITLYDTPLGVTTEAKPSAKLTDFHVGDMHLKGIA
jgi:hypothetical protein